MTHEVVIDELTTPDVAVDAFVKGLPVIDSSLAREEVLRAGLRGKRFEVIEVSLVNMEGVVVDQKRVDKLGETLFGWNSSPVVYGQLDPIQSAVFLIDGRVVYEPTNGYHRIAAFQKDGSYTIEAMSLYGLTWSEVLELRVLNQTVETVRFARVPHMMIAAWELTDFHKEDGITLLQAFSLVVAGTSGVRLQLTPEKTKAIKEWVKRTATVWRGKVGSIYQDLMIIEHADLRLVQEVRSRGGGHGEGDGAWNRARLAETVSVLPDDPRAQKIVYEAVLRKDLTAPETGAFAKAVAYFRDDPLMLDTIKSSPDIISAVVTFLPESPHLWGKIFLSAQISELKRHEIEILCQLVNGMADDPGLFEPILADPKNYLDVKSTRILSGDNKCKGALDSRMEGVTEGDETYNKERSAQSYEDEIALLKTLLQRALEKNNSRGRKPLFWKNSPHIDAGERKIFEQIFLEKLSMKEVARQLGVTEGRVLRMLQGAVARHAGGIKDELMRWLDKQLFPPEL